MRKIFKRENFLDIKLCQKAGWSVSKTVEVTCWSERVVRRAYKSPTYRKYQSLQKEDHKRSPFIATEPTRAFLPTGDAPWNDFKIVAISVAVALAAVSVVALSIFIS